MSRQTEAEHLFGNSLIAGPMVRGSSHVFRVCCLGYGANVVLSPGLVDLKLIATKRQEVDNHIVYLAESNGHHETVFRTCADERGKLVLQLVSNDGATAVQAAQKFSDIASGFDLNCGCPEHFAVHRGCGSSMELEKAVDIIKTLSREVPKPVSVKFRVDPDVNKSIQFARAVESAGASAITVHGRVKEQKHRGQVDYAKMKQIFDSVKIFKVANGGIASLVEAEKVKQETGCNSVMICGAALKNPSVFSTTPVSEFQALTDMVRTAKYHEIPFNECKWSLQQIVSSKKEMSKTMNEGFSACKTWEEMDRVLSESIAVLNE